MTSDRALTYNLGSVLHETGIAADTLRAWERRYGVPMPRRTPGGHRLYTEQDVQLIKWLMSRQAEGLSISRAVDQWRALVQSGEYPAQAGQAAITPTSHFAPDNLDVLRGDWLAACLQFDEVEAEQVLDQAFAQATVEAVLEQVIQAGLREMGESWARGQASVHQEHFLSALASRRLDQLIAAAPPPIRNQVILVACAESEQHDLPLMHLTLLLRRLGGKAVFLGADVPSEQLVQTARATNAAMVVLAAQLLASAARLRQTAVELTQNGLQVAYGGRPFASAPALRRIIPGHYTGDDITSSAARVAQLAQHPQKAPQAVDVVPHPLAHEYPKVLPQARIEIQQIMAGFPIAPASFEIANTHFAEAYEVALQLGEIAYLGEGQTWAWALFEGKAPSAESLRAYLMAQSKAIRFVLGTPAESIADWLESYAAGLEL